MSPSLLCRWVLPTRQGQVYKSRHWASTESILSPFLPSSLALCLSQSLPVTTMGWDPPNVLGFPCTSSGLPVARTHVYWLVAWVREVDPWVPLSQAHTPLCRLCEYTHLALPEVESRNPGWPWICIDPAQVTHVLTFEPLMLPCMLQP